VRHLGACGRCATATASNSDAAHACQQNGWQQLFRGDGTGFASNSDCVSYAAGGNTLWRGFENFSGAAYQAQPSTFSGGTIDPSDYAPGAPLPNGWGGSILVAGPLRFVCARADAVGGCPPRP
jgi:hypothetical protein